VEYIIGSQLKAIPAIKKKKKKKGETLSEETKN
jgi:hypothetical protein